MKFIKEKCAGNIFLIPLYLPTYQIWRDREDLISYKKYKFHIDDNYAFGRIIDEYKGGGDLIEVFRYVGKIPSDPAAITASGRLFEPVHVMLAFSKKRYPFIFSNNKFNKYQESDYENISFLLMTDLWKGGEKIKITQTEKNKLEKNGVPLWIVYTGTQIEERIRSALKNIGIELNYDKIVEQRKEEFPVIKVKAHALQKKLIPFVLNEDGNFFMSVGSFKNDFFIKEGLLGNGYEWEKVFINFVRKNRSEFLEKIICDSEAGTFSVTSLDEKVLQVIALEFRNFCENEEDFKKALNALK